MSASRVALIAGTSSGIGLLTAVGLARSGLRVIATMRDTAKATVLQNAAEQAGVKVEVRALDVVDEVQGAVLVADLGRIDVLVNNAGRGLGRHAGAADPRRLARPAGCQLSRCRRTHPAGAAGNAFRRCGPGGDGDQHRRRGRPAVRRCILRGEVRRRGADAVLGAGRGPFRHDVSIVEPGAVATEFVGNVAGTTAVEADDPYATLLAAYLKRSEGAFANAQTSVGAAAVVVEAASTASPKFRWQTSDGAAAFAGLSLADLDGSRVLGATTSWLD